MTKHLRREIDAAILENDIDELGRLLCRYELDDEIRAVIYDGMDRVTANLERPIVIDEVAILS